MYYYFPILDLAVKQVTVNTRSSFEKFRLYLVTLCYIPSFKAIGILVLENKVLKGSPYMGMATILVMLQDSFV